MDYSIKTTDLIAKGMTDQAAHALDASLNRLFSTSTNPQQIWFALISQADFMSAPFSVHLLVFTTLFPDWPDHPDTAAAWQPSPDKIKSANITPFSRSLGMTTTQDFHQWTVSHYHDFWRRIIDTLGIRFKKSPDAICEIKNGVETPEWLPGARLNIADSCFTADPRAIAIVYPDPSGSIHHMSYQELNNLSNRIANSLVARGYKAGDAIAIAMPMNQFAVAIYLGIVKMGGVVVSIADSFSSQEIATRLAISKANAIFTQDVLLWAGKQLPLYEKVVHANAPAAIVLSAQPKSAFVLREEDIAWDAFLVDNIHFESVACDPMSPCNILFSSGTTAEPKAIAWNHTTPIKAASDAYFHQNIQAQDVLAWPTNLGWMMGPWLIFAALINRAAIALYPDAPKDRVFGEYVQNAKVTMLGVVPTLVAAWRQSKCMEGLNWSTIKVFSSTGECSNAEDMFYLMWLGGYKPVIEYCGGTEIGGGYITSTVVEPNYPSLFNTPAMGIDIAILDESGQLADTGEVAIVPPSMGLSTALLNADHHQVYFANMPTLAGGQILRRHGDQIKRISANKYCVLGRVDDAMNLGGIKVSAAEIERALTGLPQITEVAAISISPPNNGPSQLVIYAATREKLDKKAVTIDMQKRINLHLNPLFKINDVVFTNELPKTASNKIMRRMLRKKYMEHLSSS